MGFLGIVTSVLAKTKSLDCRQSVLVSATLNGKLGVLASRILTDPVHVGFTAKVGADGRLDLEGAVIDEGEAFELPKGLQQLYMDVPVKLRLPTLLGMPLSEMSALLTTHTCVFLPK